jgi:hypothetical protein
VLVLRDVGCDIRCICREFLVFCSFSRTTENTGDIETTSHCNRLRGPSGLPITACLLWRIFSFVSRTGFVSPHQEIL